MNCCRKCDKQGIKQGRDELPEGKIWCVDCPCHTTSPEKNDSWEKSFDELYGNSMMPKGTLEHQKSFISQTLLEQKERIIEAIEGIETTYGVSGSDSYQIGQNHGRQEFKSKAVQLIKDL